MLFLLASFSTFLHQVNAGDLWWHMATGRWIVEHRSLPPEDPLTYTTSADGSWRKEVLLKNYWLAQTAYYVIYRLGGFSGLAAANALLFLLTLLMLYYGFRKSKADMSAALVLIALAVPFMQKFDVIRPHTFSFIFAALLYLLLDQGAAKLRSRGGATPLELKLAPVLTLIWANTHQGVVVGYGLIVLLSLQQIYEHFRKPVRDAAPPYRFVLWALISLAATFINPTHVKLLFVSAMEPLGSWTEYGKVREQLPTAEIFAMYGTLYIIMGLLYLGLIAGIVFRAWRRVKPSDAVAIFVFGAGALLKYRLFPFFVLIGPLVSAKYLPEPGSSAMKRIRPAALALVLLASVFFAVQGYVSVKRSGSWLNMDRLPAGAVSFVTSARPPQPIYNSYNWGGYLAWELGPEYKVFTTSLGIEPATFRNFLLIESGRNNDLLDSYGINTVILAPVDVVDGNVSALAISLLKSPEWRLVHMDDVSSVFVRESRASSLPAIDRNLHWNSLRSYAEMRVSQKPDDPALLSELAGIYMSMGEWDKARQTLKRRDAL